MQFQVPVFDAAQLVQAGGGNLQADSYSVPSLADWNSDQRLDLIVGEKTQAGDGKVRVYLNQGTATAPVFGSFFRVQAGGSDLTVPGNGCLGVFPRVADWDGDGRQDLVVGLAGGGIQVFLNAGSDMAPVFSGSTPVMVGEPGAKAAINLGARATIAVTDWNEDGRVDLVAGALDGQVRVYLNQAASGAPDFRAALLVNDGGVALDDASGRSSVAVIDLNGDGRKDLVLGNTAGEMRFFANVGTNAAPVFDGVVAIQAGGAAIDLAGTPRSRPFVGDFNADGTPDLLVGSEDGLIRWYEASAWPSLTASPGHTGLPGEQYTFRFELPALMWHNAARPLDVNGDGTVDLSDAMRMLDELNHPQYHGPTGAMLAPGATGASHFLLRCECRRAPHAARLPAGDQRTECRYRGRRNKRGSSVVATPVRRCCMDEGGRRDGSRIVVGALAGHRVRHRGPEWVGSDRFPSNRRDDAGRRGFAPNQFVGVGRDPRGAIRRCLKRVRRRNGAWHVGRSRCRAGHSPLIRLRCLRISHSTITPITIVKGPSASVQNSGMPEYRSIPKSVVPVTMYNTLSKTTNDRY